MRNKLSSVKIGKARRSAYRTMQSDIIFSARNYGRVLKKLQGMCEHRWVMIGEWGPEIPPPTWECTGCRLTSKTEKVNKSKRKERAK